MAHKLSENQIIQTYFAPLVRNAPGALGLLDDAALVVPVSGEDLVITVDMLVAGTHFFADDDAWDIAVKALGVNLSDLAAKGARPLGYVLSLALPREGNQSGQNWLQDFAEGLKVMQKLHGCHLIGGDTVATGGALTISITAYGSVPSGLMVKRSGASPGERVYVSGTIGDAALGLRLRVDPGLAQCLGLNTAQRDYLLSRYHRPEPRTALAEILLHQASAAMDVSDGLIGDFEKLCGASSVGGVIKANSVPFSVAGKAALEKDPELLEVMLSGGDDYEILAAVPEERIGQFQQQAEVAGCTVTEIGCITAQAEMIKVIGEDGLEMTFKARSYSHF